MPTEQYRPRTAPIEVFRFKPGPEAKAHPLIKFSPAWEPEDGGGPGFPDTYWLKDGYKVDGNSGLKDGDVVITFADGSYTAMRE